MAAELRSCPFCGGKVMLCEAGGYWVNCLKCNTNGAYKDTEAEAVEAWNTRTERTCEYAIKDNMNETEGMGDVWIECSACYCVFDYYADDWLMNMHYCPNCGAKVIV